MTTLVQKAKAFSVRKHGQQTRKYDKAPYTAHLDGVVAILKRHGVTEPVILAAAYLHDTVEKTDTSVREIIDLFGTDVAKLVYWLTDDERSNRKTRKLMSAWRLSRAPWDAKLIKLADLVENTRHIVEYGAEAAPQYILEKKQTMWMMADEEGEGIMRLPLFCEAMRNDVAHNETARYKGDHNEGAHENTTDTQFKEG
jgi:(p)ppGpp synthase/HD superfamily hydrolase